MCRLYGWMEPQSKTNLENAMRPPRGRDHLLSFFSVPPHRFLTKHMFASIKRSDRYGREELVAGTYSNDINIRVVHGLLPVLCVASTIPMRQRYCPGFVDICDDLEAR
jgi:hypothetical protein